LSINYAIQLNSKDNVATVLSKIDSGDTVKVLNEAGDEVDVILKSKDVIPLYHKIALKDVGVKCEIWKYGEIIGLSTCSIERGQLVHLHNLDSAHLPEKVMN
jgi:hypothetical protein